MDGPMKFLTRQEELVLLTVHTINRETTLKEIRRLLIEHTGKEWSISSVYVPLDRLDVNGLLESRIGQPSSTRGGKAKKYYSITEEGKSALVELRELADSLWKRIDGFAING